MSNLYVYFSEVGRTKASWSTVMPDDDLLVGRILKDIRKHGRLMSRAIEFTAYVDDGPGEIVAGFHKVGVVEVCSAPKVSP